MRTTVNIDDGLLRRARELAAGASRSLGDVVDDALRLLLDERVPAATQQVRLLTYGGSGLRPGVDLEDKDAMVALLEEGQAGRAAG